MQAHEKEGYKWWAQRLGRVFSMHNETRIDHFRGFAGYWAVKADAKTAMGGAWLKGPGRNLFDALTKVRSCRSTGIGFAYHVIMTQARPQPGARCTATRQTTGRCTQDIQCSTYTRSYQISSSRETHTITPF